MTLYSENIHKITLQGFCLKGALQFRLYTPLAMEKGLQ